MRKTQKYIIKELKSINFLSDALSRAKYKKRKDLSLFDGKNQLYEYTIQSYKLWMKQPLLYERTKRILNIIILSTTLHLNFSNFDIPFIEIFLLSNILDIIRAIFRKEAIIYSLVYYTYLLYSLFRSDVRKNWPFRVNNERWFNKRWSQYACRVHSIVATRTSSHRSRVKRKDEEMMKNLKI